MRVRLTDASDGAVFLESRYQEWAPVKDVFKVVIPPEGRRWDASLKRWVVGALYVSELLAFLRQHGALIQDDRQPQPQQEPLARVAMPDDLRAAFEALHLSATAPMAVAEASFRALAKLYHPDARSGSVDHFHAVNDAIKVIRTYLNPKEDTHHAVPF